jgi:hypothetical protein
MFEDDEQEEDADQVYPGPMDLAERALRERFPNWLTRGSIIAVSDGWALIVLDLFDAIAAKVGKDADIWVGAIKTQFAGLGVAYHAQDAIRDRIQPLVAQADAAARRTCEICAAPGRHSVDGSGCYATMCAVHREEHGFRVAALSRH